MQAAPSKASRTTVEPPRRTVSERRADTEKVTNPPTPMVAAPMETADACSGAKVATVPVVPHSAEAVRTKRAPVPYVWGVARSAGARRLMMCMSCSVCG